MPRTTPAPLVGDPPWQQMADAEHEERCVGGYVYYGTLTTARGTGRIRTPCWVCRRQEGNPLPPTWDGSTVRAARTTATERNVGRGPHGW